MLPRRQLSIRQKRAPRTTIWAQWHHFQTMTMHLAWSFEQVCNRHHLDSGSSTNDNNFNTNNNKQQQKIQWTKDTFLSRSLWLLSTLEELEVLLLFVFALLNKPPLYRCSNNHFFSFTAHSFVCLVFVVKWTQRESEERFEVDNGRSFDSVTCSLVQKKTPSLVITFFFWTRNPSFLLSFNKST